MPEVMPNISQNRSLWSLDAAKARRLLPRTLCLIKEILVPLPTNDDGMRGSVGVVASLLETSEGRLCLVLDDVRHQLGADTSHWNHNSFFTAREYLRKDLEDLNLSKEEFAQIGENIIVRILAAANGRSVYRGSDAA